MITHEEARKTMMSLETDDAYYGFRVNEHKTMALYITQQEKADIFLQKNLKLLGLYQDYAINKPKNVSALDYCSEYNCSDEVDTKNDAEELRLSKLFKEIKELECELNE